VVVLSQGRLSAIPIESVAGKQRKVPLDDPLVVAARAWHRLRGLVPASTVLRRACDRRPTQHFQPGDPSHKQVALRSHADHSTRWPQVTASPELTKQSTWRT